MYDYDSIDIENKYTVNAIFDEIAKKIYRDITSHNIPILNSTLFFF